LSISPLFAASDRILVLPSLSGGTATIIQPDGPTQETTFAAPLGAFKVLQDGTGDTYYILSNRASQAVTVVDAGTLQPLAVIPLGTGVSDGVITPDGRYLLVTAGSLIVIDLQSLETVDTVSVGGSARVIVAASTFAYVMAAFARARQIHAVDLETLEVVAETPETDGLPIWSGGGRNLIVAAADPAWFLPGDLAKIDDFEPNPDFTKRSCTLSPAEPGAVRGTDGSVTRHVYWSTGFQSLFLHGQHF
jgi:hypothetical protein